MDFTLLTALAKQTTYVGVLDDGVCGIATNASCGDACRVSLRIAGDEILAMKYDATGCLVSRAAAAVLAEAARGPYRRMMSMNGMTMRELLGFDVSPLRERCLTTALIALQNAIQTYEASR